LICGWIHCGPTYLYLKIVSDNQILYYQKQPLFLAWSDPQFINDEDLADILQTKLHEWSQILKELAVMQLRITLSAALINSPFLPIIRLQIKASDLPSPILWNDQDEVRHLSAITRAETSEQLIVGLCEHKLYLIIRKSLQPEFSLTLPCGLVDLYLKYCRHDPPEVDEVIALRREIVANLEIFQFYQSPPPIVSVTDAGILLGSRITPDDRTVTISKQTLDEHLTFLLKNYQQTIRQRLGNSPFIPLLIPAALIYQHLFDFLRLEAITVFPYDLVFPVTEESR